MAIRNIVYEGSEILTKECKKVKAFDEKLWELLDDMKETMVKYDGVGLAGPQVGVIKQVAVILVNNMYLELINPEILETAGHQYEIEGCLSVKNFNGVVDRPAEITVKASDRYGNDFIITGVGLLARALSHEIDHLHGVLFTSKVISKNGRNKK